MEYNINDGVIVLNRTLASSLHYPGDYGLIPQTFFEDGEPLDILTMTGEPTFPGCVIQARPVGIFRMLDGDLHDDKVLAVAATDPLFARISGSEGYSAALPARGAALLRDVQRPGGRKRVKALGWEDEAVAKEEILRAHRLFMERFGLKGLYR